MNADKTQMAEKGVASAHGVSWSNHFPLHSPRPASRSQSPNRKRKMQHYMNATALEKLTVPPAIGSVSWHHVAEAMPDSAETVLVFMPGAADEVWIGYHDAECWRVASGEKCETQVAWWAHIPEGGR